MSWLTMIFINIEATLVLRARVMERIFMFVNAAMRSKQSVIQYWEIINGGGIFVIFVQHLTPQNQNHLIPQMRKVYH